MVAFDLTLPGNDSREPRRILSIALGAYARIQLVATDRRHDTITLHVQVPAGTFSDAIGVIIAHFMQATIGRATAFSTRR